MNRFFLVFFLLMAPVISFQSGAQERHALVIGVGEYADSRWGKIHADTDVDYVLEILHENGFVKIKTLKNADASKEAIVAAFDSLKCSCSPGDLVYVHFSGHGQQITDTNGDERDGYDEAWIPYDAQPYYCESYKGEKHLVDDEVNRMLSGIKELIGPDGKILVVVDACCSGDATRGTEEGIARGFNKKFDIPGCKPDRMPELKEEWITISACKPYQVNWEMSNPQVGKLTWCLHELRGRLGKLSNDDLKASISRLMQQNPGPVEQTPLFTGNVSVQSVRDVFK